MMHLAADELIDAVEGVLPPERQVHLDACPDCRRQFDDLSSVLNDTRHASVPEPPPVYWRQLSAHVRAAVDAEPQAWPSWLRWQVFVPLSAVALLVVALIISLPRPPASVAHVDAPIAGDAPANADAGDALELLAGDFDIDAAAEAGVLEPGVADEALLQLTAEERAELTRLLQAELMRSQS